MSLRDWLLRPLARFLRHCWMSKDLFWSSRPKKGRAPRRPVHLHGLTQLELRETPLDVTGLLTGGLTLAGQFSLPALLQSGPRPPLLPVSAAALRAPEAAPPRDPGTAFTAGTALVSAAGDPARDRAPAAPPTAPGVSDAAPVEGLLGGDWFNAVGAALGHQPAPRPRIATPPDDATPRNGGGGGDVTSSHPGSGTQSSGGGATDTGGTSSGADLLPGGTTFTSAADAGAAAAGSVVTTTAAAAGEGDEGGQPVQALDAGARPARPSLAASYAATALPFEMNLGQTDPSVRFLTRSAGLSFWLTGEALVFAVPRPAESGQSRSAGRDVFRFTLDGVSASAEVFGRSPMHQRSNYFVGSDSSQWLADVPNYARVEYQGVWPGIDLVLRGSDRGGREFEYDFKVAPGAEASSIRLRPSGLSGLRTDEQGQLLLTLGGRDVVMGAPVLYQEAANGVRDSVSGRYVLDQDGSVGFEVTGTRDPSRALVIDPVLSFSSYLGGSGEDIGYAVAVDAAGASYVTGQTLSSDFPASDGYDTSLATGTDAFVTKVAPSGREVLYSTYLGGTSNDASYAIAVGLDGTAHVAGSTSSSNFPTTAGAYQTSIGMTATVGFITRLNASGDALVYSTFLGGDGTAAIYAIAVNAHGTAYVTGSTNDGMMSDFPTTGGAYQTAFPNTFGNHSPFLSALSASGTSLLASTYLGGSGASDHGYGIALDGSGNVYVTGQAGSSNFPTTGGAVQTSKSGSTDAFVSKLNASLTSLSASTYLGGSSAESGNAIAVARDGSRVYVTGVTNSSNFPTASAYQASSGGGDDAFVSALDGALTTLSYSTYLGGAASDVGRGIAVDVQGRATVVGSTALVLLGGSFPTTPDAFQSAFGGGTYDGFVTRLAATGTMNYSSFLGGGGTSTEDHARAVALDVYGNAYVTGQTNSTTFPAGARPGFQAANAGGTDAFVAKVLPGPDVPVITTITNDTGASASDRITSDQTLSLSGTAGANATVTLERVGYGTLGSVQADGSGLWTYTYAATLTEDTYAFTARAFDGSSWSDDAKDFLVHVDLTAPSVTLSAPPSTTSKAFDVLVRASDRFGLAASPTVTLDVDLNNDGDYLDPGEAGYASGTLGHGMAIIKLPALSSTGTVRVRARVLDLAGNEGTSASATVVVSNQASPWVATAQALTVGPLVSGDWLGVLGDVSTAHALDLDTSPGTQQAGNPTLVYHSSQVSQKPIVQLTLPSDTASALPANVTAVLTFDGTAAATVTYSTSGLASGDVLTLALQAPNAITTTGRYGYSVLVQVSGQADQTVTGSVFIVAQDSSPYGAGWSLSGVDSLVSIAADANGPAGVLRVLGSGGYQFYAGTTSFTSEAGDPGTLSLSGTTYTYGTPDGRAWTFNSSGEQVLYASADGNETIEYRYTTGKLTGLTAIDGTLTTVTYNGSTDVTFLTSNNRTTTITLSAGDATRITNPDGGVRTFTYDGNHRLTRDQYGPNVEANYAYRPSGVVGTITQGAITVNGVSNPTRSVLGPAVIQGLAALNAGTVYGQVTDPNGGVTRSEYDSRGRPLQGVAADGALSKYTYNNGYLETVTDPLGRVTTMTRDGSGYVTKTELPDGSVLTYAYQTNFHALTTMVNERGYTTTYGYDGSGHLIRQTDALGNATAYEYGPGGLLTTITDARGNVSVNEYDAARRLTRTVDALGHGTSYAYDPNGNVRTVTDALLRVTTITSDVMGRRTAVQDGLGNTHTTTYDPAGMPLTTTNPVGVQAGTAYDVFLRGMAARSLQTGGGLTLGTVATFDDGGRPVSSRDPAGYSSDATLDIMGRATDTTDAKGATTRTWYDAVGRAISSRGPLGRWFTNGYDSRDRIITRTDALGNVTTMAYDKAGNVTAQTDALGKTLTTTYDALNRATGTEDALGRRTTTTYDPVGNVLTTSDHNGNVTSTAYDALNRAVTVTYAVGSAVAFTTETFYDEVGNVTATKDGRGKLTTYSYDAVNRQTATEDALNHRTTATYDAAGGVVSQTDALGKVVTLGYDGLHRQVSVKDPLGLLTTTVLDARGQGTATIDPLGNVPLMVPDELGRSAGSVDAQGAVARTLTDAAGGTRMIVDQVGNEWRYEVDGLGRETVSFDPLGARTTTAYDALSRVTQVTDRNGKVTEYGYDDGDRVTREVWKSNAGVTLNVVTYGYDANDNRTSAWDSAGRVTYTYDELNRVRSYANVFGQVLTYTYDASSNVTLRTDSLGGVLTSTYDDAGRLTSRQFDGAGQTPIRVDLGYTDRNEQSSLKWFSNLNGTGTVAYSAYAHDDAGRLTGITNKDTSNATLSYYNYAHDDKGRVSAHTFWSQVGTVVYSGTRTYTYDATDQVTDDGTTAYTYDSAGNRTMAGYATGSANRMSSDGVFTYTHDAHGNEIEKSKGSGLEAWYSAYDNRNRLVNVRKTSDGSTTTLSVTYTYDAEDRLVQEDKWKTGVGTVTTRHAWDGEQAWADLDGSNVVLVRPFYGEGTDQVLARTAGADTFVYLTDNIGSVRDVVSWAGAVVNNIQYDAFGIATESNPDPTDKARFAGGDYDADLDWSRFGARLFVAPTGRWTQPDPIVFGGGDHNLYRYVGNNPTNWTDPSGLLSPALAAMISAELLVPPPQPQPGVIIIPKPVPIPPKVPIDGITDPVELSDCPIRGLRRPGGIGSRRRCPWAPGG